MAAKKVTLDPGADTTGWGGCEFSPHPSGKCPYHNRVLECARHDVGCRKPEEGGQ